MLSICKKYCQHFSEGKRSQQGSIGGYGCQKYSVASHCQVDDVKGVAATQYELFVEEGELSPKRRDLIKIAVPELREIPNEELGFN